MPEIVFETERPWRADEDAEGALAMYGDPEMVRYIGGQLVASLDEQRERLAMILERNRSVWNDRYGSWPLIEKASDKLVGCAILKPPPASGSGGKQFSDEVEI